MRIFHKLFELDMENYTFYLCKGDFLLQKNPVSFRFPIWNDFVYSDLFKTYVSYVFYLSIF